MSISEQAEQHANEAAPRDDGSRDTWLLIPTTLYDASWVRAKQRKKIFRAFERCLLARTPRYPHPLPYKAAALQKARSDDLTSSSSSKKQKTEKQKTEEPVRLFWLLFRDVFMLTCTSYFFLDPRAFCQ
jgi:hypothetical protein